MLIYFRNFFIQNEGCLHQMKNLPSFRPNLRLEETSIQNRTVNCCLPIKRTLADFRATQFKKCIHDRKKVNDTIYFKSNPINCKRYYDNKNNSRNIFKKTNTGCNQKSISYKMNSLYENNQTSNRNTAFSRKSTFNQNNNRQLNDHNQTQYNLRSTYLQNLFHESNQFRNSRMPGVPFKPQKVLILTKFSRLEYERKRLSGYTEDEIKENLIRRGSDYEGLVNHHNIHTKSRDHVVKTLEEFQIEYKIVNRFEYDKKKIDWADVIITTGGDGTFLMGASKIFNKNKLIIGINSDPSRSVGHLCLQPIYSLNFKAALEKLINGNFKFIYRQRIRISIKGENSNDPPAELHDQQLLYPEYRYLDLETHPLNRRSSSPFKLDSLNYEYEVIPVRALNDVYIGECLSSRVSYFELSLENKPYIKVKSSGITICTGTGSTSWSFNINKISPQSVQTLFKLINEETNLNLDSSNSNLVQKITKQFNDLLIFDVCEKSIAYVIRDPVYMGNSFDTSNKGFVQNLNIKSRMFDACVVIDGGLTYKFNDGAYAKLETLDEDQLKTVCFES